MTYNPMRDLKEFHDTFSPDQRKDSFEDKMDRRMSLLYEEFMEVRESLVYLDNTEFGMTSSNYDEALIELAGELADLLYVTYGTAEEFGIPLQEVFQAVHTANMSKVWDDGQVHRNEYGKVIKPPNFVKADIREVLYGEG